MVRPPICRIKTPMCSSFFSLPFGSSDVISSVSLSDGAVSAVEPPAVALSRVPQEDRTHEQRGGEFRTIMMTKSEDVLGGDTVRYAYPKEIKKQLTETMKEVGKLKRTGDNDKDIVFRLTRIIASIWQTRPFREGNTRAVIVFAILLAKHLGFEVDHELFRVHSSYVRNALVWASQGMYSEYQLPRIVSLFETLINRTYELKNCPLAAPLDLSKIIRYFEVGAQTELGIDMVERGVPVITVRKIEKKHIQGDTLSEQKQYFKNNVQK